MSVAEDGWGPVNWDKVKSTWQECCASIVCPCGEDVYLDGQDESTRCECGRTYRMSSQIEVKQA